MLQPHQCPKTAAYDFKIVTTEAWGWWQSYPTLEDFVIPSFAEEAGLQLRRAVIFVPVALLFQRTEPTVAVIVAVTERCSELVMTVCLQDY